MKTNNKILDINDYNLLSMATTRILNKLQRYLKDDSHSVNDRLTTMHNIESIIDELQ